MADSVWTRDWNERLELRFRSLGYQTIGELLVHRPGAPCKRIAQELGDGFCAAQVEKFFVDECRRSGKLSEAVADVLCRTINDIFPSGWGVGKDPVF